MTIMKILFDYYCDTDISILEMANKVALGQQSVVENDFAKIWVVVRVTSGKKVVIVIINREIEYIFSALSFHSKKQQG